MNQLQSYNPPERVHMSQLAGLINQAISTQAQAQEAQMKANDSGLLVDSLNKFSKQVKQADGTVDHQVDLNGLLQHYMSNGGDLNTGLSQLKDMKVISAPDKMDPLQAMMLKASLANQSYADKEAIRDAKFAAKQEQFDTSHLKNTVDTSVNAYVPTGAFGSELEQDNARKLLIDAHNAGVPVSKLPEVMQAGKISNWWDDPVRNLANPSAGTGLTAAAIIMAAMHPATKPFVMNNKKLLAGLLGTEHIMTSGDHTTTPLGSAFGIDAIDKKNMQDTAQKIINKNRTID
jgi:hypothetical protein